MALPVIPEVVVRNNSQQLQVALPISDGFRDSDV